MLGNWVLVEMIGSGGFAEVFAAVHRESGQRAAIKILLEEHVGDKEAHGSISNEFDVLKGIDIRGVPKARILGEVCGRPAFAMEFIDGRSVHDLVATRSGIDVVSTLVAMIRVVGRIHAAGLVHNDLKPENFFLAMPQGRVFAIDFGNARWADAPSQGLFGRLFKRKKKRISGTPSYMAPELLKGTEPSYRTDVYALGACAHFVLTGHPPIDGSDAASKIRKALGEGAGSISECIARLPRDLVQIIDRACSQDPDARPLDAQAMAHQLKVHFESGRYPKPKELNQLIRKQLSAREGE
jgi:serine/threonine-protein kinase